MGGESEFMVPILLYRRTAFAFASTPIGKLGKNYCFFCIECLKPALKVTKEQLKELKDPDLKSLDDDRKSIYYFKMGNGYQRLWELDPSIAREGERLLKLAIKIKPDEFMPHNCLSVLYLNMGGQKIREAFKQSQRALELSSDDSERETALYNTALIYGETGNNDKCIDYLKQAIEIMPVAGYYYNLGIAYLSDRQHEKAKQAFLKYINAEDIENKIYSDDEARDAIKLCDIRLTGKSKWSEP